MILAGFLGETKMINRMLGFIIGTFAWFYILYEIIFGESCLNLKMKLMISLLN